MTKFFFSFRPFLRCRIPYTVFRISLKLSTCDACCVSLAVEITSSGLWISFSHFYQDSRVEIIQWSMNFSYQFLYLGQNSWIWSFSDCNMKFCCSLHFSFQLNKITGIFSIMLRYILYISIFDTGWHLQTWMHHLGNKFLQLLALLNLLKVY